MKSRTNPNRRSPSAKKRRLSFLGLDATRKGLARRPRFEQLEDRALLATLSINDVSLVEGNAGTANLVFNVTLSEASPDTVTVDFSTADDSATAGSDYVATSGTLTFAPSGTSQTITVQINGDLLDEFDETFAVNLSNPANATIDDAQGIGTIVDNDAPPAISIDNLYIVEGDSGTTFADFTVSLSAPSGKTVQVTGSTANGTATAPGDYTAVVNSVGSFAPGVTSLTFQVLVTGETTPEPNETFFVNLSSPSNATIADGQGVGTILNDDNGVIVFGTAGNDTVVIDATGPDSGSYQVTTDGTPGPVVPFSNLVTFSFLGLAGNDTLIINHPAGGVFAPTFGIFYDGGDQASSPLGDTLRIAGGSATTITYDFANAHDGTIDIDGSVITYTGLEPIFDNMDAANRVFNFNNNPQTITLQDDINQPGGAIAGMSQIASPGEAEIVFFNNPTASLTVNGGNGGNTINIFPTLDANYATPITSINSGNGNDEVRVLRVAAGTSVDVDMETGASDRVVVGASSYPGSNSGTGAGTLNNILGTVNVADAGGQGELFVDASGDSAGTYDFSATQISRGVAVITYTAEISPVHLATGNGDDIVNVTGTSAPVNTVFTNGGSDEVRVTAVSAGDALSVDTGNGVPGDRTVIGVSTFAAFNTGVGSLADIQGVVNVDDSGSVGELYVDDSGDPNADVVTFTSSSIVGAAPGTINYEGSNLNIVQLALGTGNDTVDVLSTGAEDFSSGATTIFGNAGDEAFTINGDGLSGNNVFRGDGGNDSFVLNIATHLGSGAVAYSPLASLLIDGNDPAADSENRDRLTINDNNAAFARNLNFDYLDTAGDLDILAGAVGAGYAGPVNGGLAVNVRGMETVVTTSASENDTVRVTGTSADDLLTAVPGPAGTSLVFLGGNPYLDAPPESLAGFLPGLAGGGQGPDLFLDGISAAGLTLDGGAAAGEGNRAVVQAVSESSISTGGDLDIFGFGAGVLIPGAGAGNAYDTIAVSDSQVLVSNNLLGSLTAINLETASFDQTSADTPFQRAALIVNGGDEAVAQANGISDDITAAVSAVFNIQVNGNLPSLVLGADGLPLGDQLNIEGPGDINIFSDKATPPNVTVTFSGNSGPFGISHSSIERLKLDAAGVRVNLIGDNNDPAVDQNDNFVVRGRDIDGFTSVDAGYQEMTVSINGSAPILLDNVQWLNVYGDDATLTPSVGPNDIDTLDIQAYADNSANPPNNAPRGWGVDVFFDEGLPNQTDGEQQDLLIYHTSAGLGGGGSVSEDIVVVPSGPDNGEIRVTNAADGSVIVVIQYVANTDLIFIDDDGSLSDTDSLTLRGTDPNTVQTSGHESFVVNYAAAETVADPLVVVSDIGPAPALLYRVRQIDGFSTVQYEPLAGNDVVTMSGPLPTSITIDLGAGNDQFNGAGVTTGFATVFGNLGDDVLVGTPNADLVYGGSGNDTINGGGGNDQLYGDEGNDILDGDQGADQMFGGDGSDLFIWDPGDGSDLIEGGAGDGDELRFNGSAGANRVEVFGGGEFENPAFPGTPGDASRAIVALNSTAFLTAAVFVDTADVEAIHVDLLGGSDELIVNNQVPNQSTAGSFLQAGTDLAHTQVRSITGDLGSNDAVVDRVEIHGRLTADQINIRSLGTDFLLGTVDVAGFNYSVNIDQSVGGIGGDLLVVRGQTGDDTINAEPGVEDRINLQLEGDEGNDLLQGSGGNDVLSGGIGDDLLDGRGGDDTITGGAGEDTMIGGAGLDTFDGGADFDTVLLTGTSGSDIISANQTAPTTLVTTLNGVIDTDTLVTAGGVRTVERVRIEAGSGDDTIFVMHVDSLGTSAVVDAVVFDIDGGSAATRDRLSVQDNGTGDLVLYRKGESDSAGSISIGPGNAESLENVFSNVEFIQPIAGVDGQLLVFKHDGNENNDERINATHLGAGDTINVDPTIDPGPFAAAPAGFEPLPGDQDWYRIIAEQTGTLDIQVYFTMLATVPSGRPGLPDGGNLDIELYDADGTLIVDGLGAFGLNDADDDERIRIPAVEGQIYFLRVFGVDAAINNYNITVINTPATVPFDLELDDVIATSTVVGGVLANQFNAGAALPAVDDFFNDKDIVFTSGPLNGLRGRVLDYLGATQTFVFATNTFANFTTLAGFVGSTFQIESIDTGRSQLDNITQDNTPTIFIRVADSAVLNDIPDNNGNPGSPPDETIVIPFVPSTADNAPSAGFRVAVFRTENDTHTQVGYAQQVAGSPGVYSFTFPVAIPDGSHFLSARVEMIDPASPEEAQGFGAFAQSLEIVVDTQPPPVFFGLPNVPGDGLLPGSDTGLNTNPETLIDLVTSVTNPGFFGQAEADAVIRLFIDAPQPGFPTGNGIFESAIDFQIGFDVAEPFDGTNQYPTGYWQVDAINVNLNAPPFDPVDGLRRIFVTAEDVAGNINANPDLGQVVQELEFFIDTQGPQITDVEINNVGNPYDLFDPKPSNDGPTPLVQSIVLSIQDLPLRTPEFLVPAIKDDIAENPGHYLLTGDYNGIIPIQDVIVTLLPVVAGQPATATIELVFWDFGPDGQPFTLDDVGGPLPDDRFTLFVNDEGIIDRAGNILDGESNADEPHDQDALFPEILGVDGFPTGDGLPGGDFYARFTIDTRPEVGTWGAGSAWIDTNGNTSFDPNNLDFTNRDIVYMLGLTSDDLFAGNFALGAGDVADGFDKLAAYGRVSGQWRWLIDTDNDGVPNINQVDPAAINGLPFAGNFDGNAANGDEVGVFTGTTWWFDTNHDFQVDSSITNAAGFVGYPVVGDFDGDGNDDLGTWTDDTFRFDLSTLGPTPNADLPGLSGTIDNWFRFGFSGPNERPVAADLNQDGFDDIGLFVPNRAGVSPDESAEWYILVSGEVQNNDNNGLGILGPSIINRIVSDPITSQNVVRFTPVPFGNDLYVQYGDEFSMPILGNFDPPVTASGTTGGEDRDPLDVNNDGKVSPLDVLTIVNHLNRNNGASTPVVQTEFPRAPFMDVNNSGTVSVSDIVPIVNYLNRQASSVPSPEGEADDFFGTLGQTSQAQDDDLLSLLADDLETQRRRRG